MSARFARSSKLPSRRIASSTPTGIAALSTPTGSSRKCWKSDPDGKSKTFSAAVIRDGDGTASPVSHAESDDCATRNRFASSSCGMFSRVRASRIARPNARLSATSELPLTIEQPYRSAIAARSSDVIQGTGDVEGRTGTTGPTTELLKPPSVAASAAPAVPLRR